MPYKSRKNRRTIPANNVSVTSSMAATEKIDSNTSASKAVKSSVVYGNNSKTAVPVQTHFLNEIKWIGLVAVIIVILLLVAYYIFR